VSHQNLLFAIFCPAQPLHLLFTVEEEEDEDEDEEVMVVAATLKTPNPADPLPSSGEVELE